MQDSRQRIVYKKLTPMIIELNFEKISKTVKNSTAQLRKPVNLSETSRDTAGEHERVADSLQSF